jgi:2-C-methyl-D-erythritol 4-phosphate cytidylyltransferase
MLNELAATKATRYWAVVPAAGIGKRMGGDVPKQYLALKGTPVLQHTVARLLSLTVFSGIVVALGAEDEYWASLPCSREPRVMVVPGGAERADSVLSALIGLDEIAAPDDWILVHDAARSCVMPSDVEKLMESLSDDPIGGILAVPVSDTLKVVDGNRIEASADRQRIWRALTPQMFRYHMLRRALVEAIRRGDTVTDEAGAIERLGLHPKIVEGRPDNIKITRPEDLPLAEYFLERQCLE